MAKGCAWIVKTQRHPCGRPRTLRPHSALQHGHTTFMSVPQDERVFIARRYAIHAARKPGVATRATHASAAASPLSSGLPVYVGFDRRESGHDARLSSRAAIAKYQMD